MHIFFMDLLLNRTGKADVMKTIKILATLRSTVSLFPINVLTQIMRTCFRNSDARICEQESGSSKHLRVLDAVWFSAQSLVQTSRVDWSQFCLSKSKNQDGFLYSFHAQFSQALSIGNLPCIKKFTKIRAIVKSASFQRRRLGINALYKVASLLPCPCSTFRLSVTMSKQPVLHFFCKTDFHFKI